jgi:flagellar motor switch protein FliN/FliY
VPFGEGRAGLHRRVFLGNQIDPDIDKAVEQIMANANLQIVPVGSDRVNSTPGNDGADAPKVSVYVAMEAHPAWPMIGRLPVTLGVSIPLRGFKLRDLLELASGQTLASGWAVTEDVPLKTGAVNVCWGEFEVVEQRIAIRMTRLA